MINLSTIILLFLLFIFLVILYAISVMCCCNYFDVKDIDVNIITLLISLTPILNLIVALKDINWKNVAKIFKDNSDEQVSKG